MQVQMQNEYIGVEKLKESAKDKGFLSMPDAIHAVGIVRYTFDGCPYEIGQKVYFGSKREQILMQGANIEVMKPDNVVAVIKE